MFEYSYDIVMQTPLGDKSGRVDLNIYHTRVSGYLHVMGKKNKFTGKVDDSGNCIISGSIVSIVSSLDYRARGSISEEEIKLTLYGRQDILNISGRVIEDLKEGD